ncbi:MAG: sigma-70 family RNA polymerase sigma factor [Bacteroidetes bacterium]|nr:sigma-70 family RNA polymerase sigma factor [Bacteroidota bacterium]MBS1540514.1 sigma-70 family RNA polymerase sigma factor [Bacteroidota bacterium]
MTEEEIRQEYEVINRSKKDPSAFGAVYEKYFDRIFRFIYNQIDNEELTADLCSQTFLSALNNLSKFEYRGLPFSAWLYRIAANEVNKHYRKTRKQKIFSLEEVRLRELFVQQEDYSEEQIKQLLQLMQELPTDMLEVLQLRFFEDKDFKEIAFILEITESGAKMRTYRALDKLRKKFNMKIRYGQE